MKPEHINQLASMLKNVWKVEIPFKKDGDSLMILLAPKQTKDIATIIGLLKKYSIPAGRYTAKDKNKTQLIEIPNKFATDLIELVQEIIEIDQGPTWLINLIFDENELDAMKITHDENKDNSNSIPDKTYKRIKLHNAANNICNEHKGNNKKRICRAPNGNNNAIEVEQIDITQNYKQMINKDR